MTVGSNREKLFAPVRVREVRKLLTMCTGPTKTPWIPKGSPKDPTSSQKQPQGSPRPPQRISKGSPKGFQGSPRHPKRTPRGFQKSRKAWAKPQCYRFKEMSRRGFARTFPATSFPGEMKWRGLPPMRAMCLVFLLLQSFALLQLR